MLKIVEIGLLPTIKQNLTAQNITLKQVKGGLIKMEFTDKEKEKLKEGIKEFKKTYGDTSKKPFDSDRMKVLSNFFDYTFPALKYVEEKTSNLQSLTAKLSQFFDRKEFNTLKYAFEKYKSQNTEYGKLMQKKRVLSVYNDLQGDIEQLNRIVSFTEIIDEENGTDETSY